MDDDWPNYQLVGNATCCLCGYVFFIQYETDKSLRLCSDFQLETCNPAWERSGICTDCEGYKGNKCMRLKYVGDVMEYVESQREESLWDLLPRDIKLYIMDLAGTVRIFGEFALTGCMTKERYNAVFWSFPRAEERGKQTTIGDYFKVKKRKKSEGVN